MTDEAEDTEDTEPTTNTPPINTAVVFGRMVIAAERAELSPERCVLGRLDYFPPDELKHAMQGKVKP
jgi:hypothetical protein